MESREQRALRHLALQLARLRPTLAAAVERRAERNQRLHPAAAPVLCISDEEARAHVAELALLPSPPLAAPDAKLAVEIDALRNEARAAREPLPLDAIAEHVGLDGFELDCLVLALAPELDSGYARIYAYLQDELGHRGATVELLIALAVSEPRSPSARRRALGPLGRLLRAGLLERAGDAAIGLRAALRPTERALDALLGGLRVAEGTFVDPEEVPELLGAAIGGAESGPDAALARALATSAVQIAGVFGGSDVARLARASALARAAGTRLRRIPLAPPAAALAALQRASALSAIAWIDLDAASGDERRQTLAAIEHALLGSDVRACITARHPFRPTALLAARAFAELRVEPEPLARRAAAFREGLPELEPAQCEELAARLPLDRVEIAASARVARVRRALEENGVTPELGPLVRAATALVTQREVHNFATAIVPRRGPDDLVLPPALHAQVLELARFHRAWPDIAERWGLARMQTGRGGLKALFTGDPGTGKTLSAEVIAFVLGLTLLRVDLARVVSKWVGETEKNLSSVFEEAERSHAVLFFDEADALFGKRGEVKDGADRYANLEVSFLLQQLEDHAGLVILASNLKEHVDPAFLRRLHAVLHFPRPAVAERMRIWQLALPAQAPRAPDVAIEHLAQIELTGSAIVSAGRTAALLAASEGCAEIALAHVAEAIRRELHREGRFFRRDDLLLAGAS